MPAARWQGRRVMVRWEEPSTVALDRRPEWLPGGRARVHVGTVTYGALRSRWLTLDDGSELSNIPNHAHVVDVRS